MRIEKPHLPPPPRGPSVPPPLGPPLCLGYADGMPTYEYPRPGLTTDLVVLRGRRGARELLLVRRGGEPFMDWWALPGGFVDEGERPEDAARRELAEETGLAWDGPLVQGHTYGDPGRDPRGWTVSVVYAADLGEEADVEVTGGDDAEDAAWMPVHALPPLAFDHDIIVAETLSLLGEGMEGERRG